MRISLFFFFTKFNFSPPIYNPRPYKYSLYI
ncbi:RNA-metabolising metallo-beta-lactamase, partial [Staphylococcus simulans]